MVAEQGTKGGAVYTIPLVIPLAVESVKTGPAIADCGSFPNQYGTEKAEGWESVYPEATADLPQPFAQHGSIKRTRVNAKKNISLMPSDAIRDLG